MAETPTEDVPVFDHIKSELAELLPDSWTFAPYGSYSGVIDAPTVWLVMGSLERNPQNPMGSRLAKFNLTILTPLTAMDQRESDLYDLLIELVDAIDAVPDLAWSAEAVMGMSGGYLGFDIPIQIVLNKTTAAITESEGAE